MEDQNLLKSYFERIESLSEQAKSIRSDINDIFKEAESKGFDKKVMKQALKIRSMKPEDRENLDSLLDTYLKELGI